MKIPITCDGVLRQLQFIAYHRFRRDERDTSGQKILCHSPQVSAT